MKRSRFSEGQIIGILKEQEAGISVAELCRKHGMSDASFYKWKAKYGGLEVSAADSERNRPSFRDDLPPDSDLKSLGVKRLFRPL